MDRIQISTAWPQVIVIAPLGGRMSGSLDTGQGKRPSVAIAAAARSCSHLHALSRMAIKVIKNVSLRTSPFRRGTLPLRPALSTCLVPADALVPAVASMSNSVHDSHLESIHIVLDRLTKASDLDNVSKRCLNPGCQKSHRVLP